MEIFGKLKFHYKTNLKWTKNRFFVNSLYMLYKAGRNFNFQGLKARKKAK